MKKLLMALAITAFACSGAEAQVKCTAVTKKKVARTHKVRQTSVARSQSCRAVPFQVCSINADRTSVSCYKTMDLYGLTPLNSEVTHFGPTGAVPGPTEKLSAGTVVIKGPRSGNFCRRDEANKATICQYNGKTLQRDANGVYSYLPVPGEGTIGEVLPDNSVTLLR